MNILELAIYYGSISPSSATLSSTSTFSGFFINYGSTVNENAYVGWSVSGAGDFDNDGHNDLMVGAMGVNGYSGAIYVIYGGNNLNGNINLDSLGTKGFSIIGEENSNSGISINKAGDVNGDGIDDIIIGAPSYNGNNAGSAYIIFGNNDTILSTIQLPPSADQGFSVNGLTNSNLGASVSGAGDINNDSYADIIIGAPGVNEVYVIYGGPYLTTIVNLVLPLDVTQGFSIIGPANSSFGASVSGAGDINNDNYADIIIGAPYASSHAGAAYVIYGAASGFITSSPTSVPTSAPTSTPTSIPTVKPSDIPTSQPSSQPTYIPTTKPTFQPTAKPSSNPTCQPANQPSAQPTSHPSSYPTSVPTSKPSKPYENIYNFNLETTIYSTVSSLVGGIILYLAPTFVLKNWGYKYKYVYDKKDIDDLQGYEVGLFKKNNKLIALHREVSVVREYLIEPNTRVSNGIAKDLYELISEHLDKKPLFKKNPASSLFKYIYDLEELNNLQENEIGLKYSGNLPALFCNIFCKWEELTAFKRISNDIKEIPIKISSNNAISKALYHSIASEYSALSNSVFTTYEENQLRDFLLVSGKMKPDISVFQKIFCLYTPIFKDLGKAPGVFHNILNCNGHGPEFLYDMVSLGGAIPGLVYGVCFNFLKKYQVGVNARISEDSLNAIGVYIDYHFKSLGEFKSVSNVILHMRKDDLEELPNEIDINTSSFEQVSKSVDMVDSTKKDKTCIIMSIDGMMDPDHVKLQNIQFNEFLQDIMLIKQDFNKQLAKITDSINSNKPFFSYSSEYFATTMSSAKTAVEFYPLVQSLAKNVFTIFDTNYTLPEVSNIALTTAHIGLGHLSAIQTGSTSYLPYVMSFVDSANFAARLNIISNAKELREELSANEQTISSYEAVKHCASVVLTYILPDLFICAAAKAAMPTYQCPNMNLWSKFSFAGSECYSVYKASQEPTTEDAITPLVLDTAVAIASYANGNGVFETITNVVAADWMGRMTMDFAEEISLLGTEKNFN